MVMVGSVVSCREPLFAQRAVLVAGKKNWGFFFIVIAKTLLKLV